MAKTNRYELDSFEKLVNVANSENYQMLASDLVLWLHYTIKSIEAIRKTNPKKYRNLTNWQIMESVFIWIDDGNNELLQFEVKDKLTGQISIITKK